MLNSRCIDKILTERKKVTAGHIRTPKTDIDIGARKTDIRGDDPHIRCQSKTEAEPHGRTVKWADDGLRDAAQAQIQAAQSGSMVS